MADKKENTNNNDLKQNFLSNAITDISAYIQLADTKVSIVMAAVVAILVGIVTCYEPILKMIADIKPCSWIGVLFAISTLVMVVGIISVFVFGILTIKGHSCVINYKSKWFLTKTTKEYSFEEFSKDIQKMDDKDIIENMTAELYKLNDINRQKMKTMKWTIHSFSLLLISMAVAAGLLVVNLL
ncbi:MAG: hypothetical protein IJV88_01970 [Ruminococcus sp.]|nr:hypothetical protein [Ruminococcus sp.]